MTCGERASEGKHLAPRDPSVVGQEVRDALNAHLHRDGVVPCQTACTHDVAPGWTALGVANTVGRLVERGGVAHAVEVFVEDGFVRIICTECDWFVLHDTKAHR